MRTRRLGRGPRGVLIGVGVLLSDFVGVNGLIAPELRDRARAERSCQTKKNSDMPSGMDKPMNRLGRDQSRPYDLLCLRTRSGHLSKEDTDKLEIAQPGQDITPIAFYKGLLIRASSMKNDMVKAQVNVLPGELDVIIWIS